VSAQLSLQEMDLPRRNGELAFDAPWQSRVFALAAAVVDHAFGGDREPFRQQLISAIAAEPGRPYWESWTAALEALVETLPQRPTPLRKVTRRMTAGTTDPPRAALHGVSLPSRPYITRPICEQRPHDDGKQKDAQIWRSPGRRQWLWVLRLSGQQVPAIL
jgi:hypothetical protein